jgi:hypothetical protein
MHYYSCRDKEQVEKGVIEIMDGYLRNDDGFLPKKRESINQEVEIIGNQE